MKRIAKIEALKIIKSPVMWTLLISFLAFNILTMGSDFRDDYVMENGESGDAYDELDMEQVFETKKAVLPAHLTGSYEQLVHRNYEKLQARVEEIRRTGEGNAPFYPGEKYHVFSNLFGSTGKKLLLESAAFLMLSLLLLMDYERMRKTREIVLISLTGKRVMRTKICVGALTGLLFCAVLMAGTYLFFFWKVPLAGLWDVPVSSAVLSETMGMASFPFVTFFRISLGQYFLLSLAVMFGMLLSVAGLCVALQLFIQNCYLSFLTQSLLYVGLLAVTGMRAANFIAVAKTFLNPVTLWVNCGLWFIENDFVMSFAGSEFLSVIGTGIVVVLLIVAGSIRYRRMEVRC